MNNENARQMISKTIERFQNVTKESIAVVYSWRGGISVLGQEHFRNYVAQNKEEIWHALVFENVNGDKIELPERDLEMLSNLDNIPKLNVNTLRKVASWATQRSIGE